jgi:glycosyltransferase involved in cell wall biosynthesis
VTGLLVPPHRPALLAAAIGRLVEDADMRTSMGEAGRVKARHEFDQRRVIDRTLDAYSVLLAEKGI